MYEEIKRNRFASLKDIIKHHGDDVELICENVLTMYSACSRSQAVSYHTGMNQGKQKPADCRELYQWRKTRQSRR